MSTAFIPSPSSSGFHIGPFDLHVYGIMYVFAVTAAILITRRRWEAVGGSRQLVYECAMWGFPAGIIGGRLYFVITTPSQMPQHWWGPFAIWDGGLGIWGGIAAGVAALSLAAFLVWLGHHRKVRHPGLFALYVAGYSGFRMFEESLRIDYSHHILGLRLNFFVALVLCVAGLLWFVHIQWGWPGRRAARAAPTIESG
jgi:prolipoprotein diacylglyceryltransferase